MTLNTAHRQHLADSGISDEIMAERGYCTVTDRAQVAHMAASQRQLPAIGFPVHQLGVYYTTLIRPDCPRRETKEDGAEKSVKYEWPANVKLCLDMLPRYEEALADVTIPLCITEGIKKTDAASSQAWGNKAVWISINGVWGWMDGKDADGNRYLLPDYRKIPLRGRHLILIPDSDYETNPQVKMAFDEHAKALMARGAIVGIVRFPHLGHKMGLDDAIVDGWTWDDLERAIHWCNIASGPGVEVERLRQEVEQLRREKAQQSERMQWFLSALSNPTLGPGERITNVFLKSATEANSRKTDVNGAVPISIMGIANESGQSPDSVGKHIAKMEKLGVLQRYSSPVFKHGALNDKRMPITEVKVKLLPIFDRPREIIAERKHGGRRYKQCESCGSENFVETTMIACKDCGVMHGESKERAVSLEIRQDAASGKEKITVVARQNDSSDATSSNGTSIDPAPNRNLRCLSKGGVNADVLPAPSDPHVPYVAVQASQPNLAADASTVLQDAASIKPKPASINSRPFRAIDPGWQALQLLQAERYAEQGRHNEAAYLRKIAGETHKLE